MLNTKILKETKNPEGRSRGVGRENRSKSGSIDGGWLLFVQQSDGCWHKGGHGLFGS